MAESAHVVLKAVAFRLLGHLDLYEDRMTVLVDDPNVSNLVEVSALMDVMRAEAASIPQLTGLWVSFLISHTEIVRTLVIGSRPEASVFDQLEPHTALLLDLESRCLEIATGRRGPL